MPTRAPRRRPTSCGGLRPTSAARLAQSLHPDGGDETLKKGHPNPFKADHAEFIKEQRQRSGTGGNAGRGGGQRANSAVRNMRQRHREQTALQALEKLEDKHTLERGVQVLEEVIEGSNSIEELRWFLRLAYDSKRPLVSVKARREQLLLLQSVVRRARTLGGDDSISQAMAVLKERVLPLLVNALRCGELQEAVVDTLHDILDCHVPNDTPETATEGFLQASRMILQALLDPLALGTGWDFSVKRRCVTTLAALTPELLQKARLALGGAANEGDEVRKLLGVFVQLLVHSLEVSSELHEGLLQCLAELAADEAGRTGFSSQMARELAERCASHLTETPSAAPQYLPEARHAEGRKSESPPARGKARQELTRELAMVCCLCLRSLAEGLVQQDATPDDEKATIELPQLRERVLTALSRDNLNLQRLTRGHEPLRKSIGAARQVWENLEAANDQPEPPASLAGRRPTSRNRGVASALAMRELLEAQPQLPARPYRGRSPGRGNQNRGSSPGRPARPTRAAGANQAQGPCQAGADIRNGHGELQANRDQSLFSSDDDAAVEEVYVHGGYEEEPLRDDPALMPTIHPSLLDEENGLEAPGLENHPAVQTSQSWYLEAAPAAPPEISHGGSNAPQDRKPKAMKPIEKAAWSEQEVLQGAGPMPRRKPEVCQLPHGSSPINEGGRLPGAGSPTKEATEAGRMPPKRGGPTGEATCAGRVPASAIGFMTETPPGPGAPQMLFPPVALASEDSPILAVVLDYLAAGRVDMGLQHIFQAGNERTLRALLQRLDSGETWPQLTLPVAQHFARLLVALLCRDPRSAGASEACAWIDALLRSSRRQPEALIPREDMQALQGALFDLSGMGGGPGTCAARVYYRLFHQVGQQAPPVAPGLCQGLGQAAPQQGFAMPASSLQAACA